MKRIYYCNVPNRTVANYCFNVSAILAHNIKDRDNDSVILIFEINDLTESYFKAYKKHMF